MGLSVSESRCYRLPMGYVKEWLWYLRGRRLGSAYSSDGKWILALTVQDVAWMCRALAGESSGVIGSPSDAVAWSMIQLAYLRRNLTYERKDGYVLRPPHTLSNILLSYCQPINPYWRNRGTAAKIAWRNRLAVMTPWVLEHEYPGLIEHVISIFRGEVDGEPYRGLVDFAECTDEFFERHGPADARFGNNCFWYAVGSSMWRRGLVQTAPHTRVGGSRILVPVALQLGAGAGVLFGLR